MRGCSDELRCGQCEVALPTCSHDLSVSPPLELWLQGSPVVCVCPHLLSLQVNYPPYYFEGYLHGEVDEAASSCHVGDGWICFRLTKQHRGGWGQLLGAGSEDREVMQGRHKEALEYVKEKAAEQDRLRAQRSQEEQRFAVKEQIRVGGM